MNAPAPSTQTSVGQHQSHTAALRLRGRWLFIARVIWFAYLHTISSGVVTDLTAGQLTQDGVRALHALGLSVDIYATYHIVLNTIFMFGFLTVGAVIFWRKADERMALFTSFALITFPIGFIFQTTTLPSTWWLPVQFMSFLISISFALFFYLFPNGQFVPHWMRWLMIGWVIEEGAGQLFPSFYPIARNLLFFALLVSGLAGQIYRYRHTSTPLERQQTRWVVFGLTLAFVGFLAVIVPGTFFPSFFQPGTLSYFVGETAIPLFLLFIPFSIGIAVLYHGLWDIDVIINRTLVYGALTVCVIGLYALVVGVFGVLLQVQGNVVISLFATGIIAVLFSPLRDRLQRAINHLMYGERDEPYAVITRLSQRLEVTITPEAVLPTIVETVALALKLPYVAILLKDERGFVVAASFGQPCEDPLILPLVYQVDTIGQLRLAPRVPGEAFSTADKRLLDELARHAGLAAHAVCLTTDLQRSRERLVTAREEERRRLRRDLHDGLGSALTSVMFKLDATDALLDRDPDKVRALLAEVRAQTQASISDIRRLVYNLRPPILDEWGLVAALREHLAQYALQNVQVSLNAPESFPTLPAAIEVAVYRVVLESLANVIKHAQATACTIRLALLADALTVEVQDNGVGRPAKYHAGVGITAMYERATELGGTCVVEDVVPYGTRVYASFPLERSDAG
jgi:signal transduction histidine kinase